MGPNYKHGKKENLFEKTIQKTVLMMSNQAEYIPDVPCGNIVGLVSVDDVLLKSGTISDHPECYLIRSMNYLVSPIIKVPVRPQNPKDQPILLEGLKRLSQSDQLALCKAEMTGEFTVAEKDFAKIKIIRYDPILFYKETVSATSKVECMAKSPNKHHRIYAYAEPLHQGLQNAIEKGQVTHKDDTGVRAQILSEQFEWDKEDALKIWTFGPENSGPNILVDKTYFDERINQIREPMEHYWQWSTQEGPLCEEQQRGVRMMVILNKEDKLYWQQRRLFYACEPTEKPRLQDPIYQAEILVPYGFVDGVYNCLNARKAVIIKEDYIAETPLSLLI